MAKILFVDDDVMPAELYIRALRRLDFEVDSAKTVEDTFRSLSTGRYDLIVLDIMMPSGPYPDEKTEDGLRTGLVLQAELAHQHPQVPVIVLTNVGNPDTLKSAREGGAVAVARKIDYPPFDFADLVREATSSGVLRQGKS